MIVYVVYWVDIDTHRPRNSTIKILGVLTYFHEAEKLANDYYHEGFSDDNKCYYTYIQKMKIDEISEDVQQMIDKINNERRFFEEIETEADKNFKKYIGDKYL